MNNSITIISSYSNDILLSPTGRVKGIVPGGPALFIGQALDKLAINYKLYTGQEIEVEIIKKGGEEVGRALEPSAVKDIRNVISSDWLIVSTVLDEWSFEGVKKLPPFTFVDLQGFVRDGRDFGKKQYWDMKDIPPDSIFCLKGTREEFEYIPNSIKDSQRKRMMIITNGSEDMEVYYKSDKLLIKPNKIRSLRSTIGAGDTILANIVGGMFRGKDARSALLDATDKTAKFLKESYE